MNKKILKINSFILIIIGAILMLSATILTAYGISKPSDPNSWDDLGKAFLIIGTIIIYILNLPLVISGTSTLKYLNGKNTYKLSIFSNVIGIVLYGLFIYKFIYTDILDIFNDYINGNVYIGLKIICSSITFLLFICPLIINMIGLYKEKNNLSYSVIFHRLHFIFIGAITIILIIICYNLYNYLIVSSNKIEVTKDNVYSYFDFKSELENRNLIYELPENKKELTGTKEITALDSSKKTGYTFTTVSYTDPYNLHVTTDRKFPMFVYSSYASLIKKSDKTAYYYYIGPEDWYITWYIYYINGNIYAAIGEESEYGSGWDAPLATTKYGVIVSEEKDITIYNSKNNYFVKGGGILDTRSGDLRIGFPSTVDIKNEKCMKIKVVDKVNAETLDKITKELSPQYWKTYKKN